MDDMNKNDAGGSGPEKRISPAKPEWLRIRHKAPGATSYVEGILARLSLNTVCEEANCPNRWECFARGTATFMILGRNCTRRCAFCNVAKGEPDPVDPNEPEHVAQAVADLRLKYTVITSVTRDDLEDGGADHFARVVKAIASIAPSAGIEVLIPDFGGSIESLGKVVAAEPDVLNHNIETVRRLYDKVRPGADYDRSIKIIGSVKQINPNMLTKSGIMVGLGESHSEVLDVFADLRKVGCDFLTIGQYLAPSKAHYPVAEYVHPDVFEEYRKEALEAGFRYVASAPLVRSSYMAENMFHGINKRYE